jgi:excisionase family DNA binding protein
VGQDANQDNKLLKLTEVAQIFRVTRRTLIRWVEKGRLRTHQPGGPGCSLRVSVFEVNRLLRGEEPSASDEQPLPQTHIGADLF